MGYVLLLLVHPKDETIINDVFGFWTKVFRDLSYGVKLQGSFDTEGTNVVTASEPAACNDSRKFNWLFKSKYGTLIRFNSISSAVIVTLSLVTYVKISINK